MLLKRSLIISISLFMAMLLAACGSSTTTGSSPSGSSPTAAATIAPTAAPTTAPTSSSASAIVQTATATVKGQSKTILTNAQGMTLYYLTADTATKAACTGGCAQVWPPLLFTGSGAPTSSTPLSGKLTVQTNANGSQVEYNGHPLYTFSKDTVPGQTNGEGLFGKWFVCTPDLAVQGGGSTNGGY
jgi:predicted lipoprotein with Yx(FWY)xxD motif